MKSQEKCCHNLTYCRPTSLKMFTMDCVSRKFSSESIIIYCEELKNRSIVRLDEMNYLGMGFGEIIFQLQTNCFTQIGSPKDVAKRPDL